MHELDVTCINIPLTKVVSNRILVELLGIREYKNTKGFTGGLSAAGA
jgi:hypothetical protein